MKIAVAAGLLATACIAHAADTFDAAAAFGARPSAFDVSLSTDGKRISYIAPLSGQGTELLTVELDKDEAPHHVLALQGDPDRMTKCSWVAGDRLVCELYGVHKDVNKPTGLSGTTSWMALDVNGKDMKPLGSLSQNGAYAHWSVGFNRIRDDIIDWLPDQGGLMMQRAYLATDRTGSMLGRTEHGLGVDRVDTRTLAITHVELPDPSATGFITDGHGNVRIKGDYTTELQGTTFIRRGSLLHYYYRTPGASEWKPLSTYDESTHEGFQPLAVDGTKNIAYGVKRKDGRRAIYSLSLDGALQEQLVYARPDVDVSSLYQIGRDQRVVGVSYETESWQTEFFDDNVKNTLAMLHKALPNSHLEPVDATPDGNRMILYASSDTNPGIYYLFDRSARSLRPLLANRDQLTGVKLATQKAIRYPARDGVEIPAYLTLPPGHEDIKGLPAIVLPHSGPNARDNQGFDWLPQYFANRGFAVLQPEFRGSYGYGDDWLQHNGFQSWQTAINDVLDAGHWLVNQGVAPGQLAVVGWYYGGYAALQSAVVEADTFKAVVAIAPVTDLEELAATTHISGSKAAQDFIGDGPYLKDGSPHQHAAAITAPVLLFHGTNDVTIDVEQSREMADKLKAAGKPCDLVIFDGLEHSLNDSAARTQMLRKSDEFLRKALGLPAQ